MDWRGDLMFPPAKWNCKILTASASRFTHIPLTACPVPGLMPGKAYGKLAVIGPDWISRESYA